MSAGFFFPPGKANRVQGPKASLAVQQAGSCFWNCQA